MKYWDRNAPGQHDQKRAEKTAQQDRDLGEYKIPAAHVQRSVQFSRSVMSDSVTSWTAVLSRLPCPSQLPVLAQTHVHQVHDAIQPSHPLSSPSPPAFKLSQHQGLFQEVGSLHRVAKVLEFQPQHQSFK